MNKYDLDIPIIQLPTEHGYANWTIRHAVEGVQIFGGIGSGKTSGSGRMLALKYLSEGFGGLVLTVKPDEKLAWEQYCKIAERSDDLIIIEPNGSYSFNFVEYESTKSENNEALTENIVEVLKTVIRAGEEKDSGKSDYAFWESAMDMLIFNVVDLCLLAYGTLSIETMFAIVQSLPKPKIGEVKEEPKNPESLSAFDKAYKIASEKMKAQAIHFRDNLSIEEKKEWKTQADFDQAISEALPDVRLFKFLGEFFYSSFKNLSSKTRSIIEFIFSGFMYRLLRDPVYSMFCKNKSNVVPEDCIKGKIILINLPVKKYHKVGRDCQILFKYIWQRSMEKRQVTSSSRPVFLWADEAQNFLHEHDAEYQATARSSKISTVYITQNLPNYYACMGGQKAEYRVKSFLGTLGTKIFHANADIETNKYASELIGDAEFIDPARSVTMGSDSFSQSDSVSIKTERRVRPEMFVSLKTGSQNNSYRVEGYIHKQGDALFDGLSFKKAKFNQNYIPNS